jgi:phosphatidylserine synthase
MNIDSDEAILNRTAGFPGHVRYFVIMIMIMTMTKNENKPNKTTTVIITIIIMLITSNCLSQLIRFPGCMFSENVI